MRKMTYRQMVDAGLCTSCGKESDSKICQPCRDRRNAKRREANRYEEAGKVFNGTHGSGIRLSYALKQGAILEAMEIIRNGGKR